MAQLGTQISNFFLHNARCSLLAWELKRIRDDAAWQRRMVGYVSTDGCLCVFPWGSWRVRLLHTQICCAACSPKHSHHLSSVPFPIPVQGREIKTRPGPRDTGCELLGGQRVVRQGKVTQMTTAMRTTSYFCLPVGKMQEKVQQGGRVSLLAAYIKHVFTCPGTRGYREARDPQRGLLHLAFLFL